MQDHIIQPHGGSLINLIVENEKAEGLKTQSKEWLSWDLTDRQICDLELLLNGGFSPLTGFMGKVVSLPVVPDYGLTAAGLKAEARFLKE